MGIFDKMFGQGAATAQQQPEAEKRFDQLKEKYGTALRVLDQQNIMVENLHVQDDRLLVRGVAPSQDAINKVWDQLKLVNSNPDDITLDLRVNPAAAQEKAQAKAQSYTVVSGDTLSKISKKFYGDANDYMRIFYANRDKLRDPDKIQIGQDLSIPEKG